MLPVVCRFRSLASLFYSLKNNQIVSLSTEIFHTESGGTRGPYLPSQGSPWFLLTVLMWSRKPGSQLPVRLHRRPLLLPFFSSCSAWVIRASCPPHLPLLASPLTFTLCANRVALPFRFHLVLSAHGLLLKGPSRTLCLERCYPSVLVSPPIYLPG